MSRTILPALAMAALFAGGCVKIHRQSPAPTAREPLVIDQAMLIRDYPVTTAYYANGDAIAGPVGFTYEADRYLPTEQYYIAEPFIFLGNIILLPYSLVHEPLTRSVRYNGEVYEPSFHVMPLEPKPLEPGVTAAQLEPASTRPSEQPSTPAIPIDVPPVPDVSVPTTPVEPMPADPSLPPPMDPSTPPTADPTPPAPAMPQ